MEKKKLLIINKSFELGGIQMSLANMLEAIHNDYDISLAVFNPRGPFLERVPENVKILKLSPLVEVLGMSYADCRKYGSAGQLVFKILGWTWSKIFNNTLPVALALATQKNIGEFDVVISYHHENSSNTFVTGFGKFALKKCTAKRRIAWVHADFEKTKFATKRNLRIYQKFDKIVCVSKTSAKKFLAKYPVLSDKCDYCYNFLPEEDIIRKSNLEKNVFNKSTDDVILFSACRLSEEKGLVQAITNLYPIFKKYPNLKWYIAGSGNLEGTLLKLIQERKLEQQMFLTGYCSNPYPYIKEADYLFVPSLYETYSMVAGEAHILGTTVIASDIPVMQEVLGEMDYICKDNDFASVVGKLLATNKITYLPRATGTTSNRKAEFERILEC